MMIQQTSKGILLDNCIFSFSFPLMYDDFFIDMKRKLILEPFKLQRDVLPIGNYDPLFSLDKEDAHI
jgi:hypothetical protein